MGARGPVLRAEASKLGADLVQRRIMWMMFDCGHEQICSRRVVD